MNVVGWPTVHVLLTAGFNIDPSCVSHGNEPICSASICLWIHHGLTLVNIPVAMNSAGVVTDKVETYRVFRQAGN